MIEEQPQDETARGREVKAPHHFPRVGWRDILIRTKDEVEADNLGLVAAGVAFYFFLAVFPAMAALISIYGLFTTTGDAAQHIQSLSNLLPGQARSILTDQIEAVTDQSNASLGFSALVSVFVALFSSMKGTMAMITALNIVYEESEKRGFIRLRLLAFAMTIGAVLFVSVSLAVLTVIPAVMSFLNIQGLINLSFTFLRWPALILVVITVLSVLYRVAPDRRQARWRWVTTGAVLATLLWIVASALFSWYVAEFGNYNEMYGSIGAVVLLLLWFYLTAYIFLLGAELNSELEHQTRHDTTIGKARPMGRRGAHMADTLGKASR